MILEKGIPITERVKWFRENIDLHVFNLIAKMNFLPFLKTTWSCGGHIYVYPVENITYGNLAHMGLNFVVESGSMEGKKFVKQLKNLLKDYHFAHLSLFSVHLSLNPPQEYHLHIDCLEYSEVKFLSEEKAEKYLLKKFDETYKKLNLDIESLVDKWLKRIGNLDFAKKILEDIEKS